MDKKEKLSMPSREIEIKIGQNTYTVKLPTTGQEIDIESYKDQMTGGSHRNMLMGDTYATEAYLSTAAIATFEILIPSLKNDLTIKSLRELDMLQIKNIQKAYLKYHKWIMSWREFVNQSMDDNNNEEDDK